MEEPKHVLIVDDDPGVQETFEALLFQEDYQIEFADDGLQALSKISLKRPDLILLDVMMPAMDGFEVCRRLKSNDQWKHIPVILVTALDSKDDLVRGLDAGADEFISKPVIGAELRARSRSMLRIKEQHDELLETLRLREKLTNMIVKDMKSPLSAALVYSELLKMKINEPQTFDKIEKIWMQINRLNDYLNDMLMLTKVKSGKALLNRTIIDMNQFIRGIEKKHGMTSIIKKIQLKLDIPDETKYISVDDNLLHIAIDTLIIKAMKHSPPNTSITLQLRYEEHPVDWPRPVAQIVIHGENLHIPEESLNLEKELNLDDGSSDMGVAFCAIIVKSHGGRIYIQPDAVQNTRIVVEI